MIVNKPTKEIKHKKNTKSKRRQKEGKENKDNIRKNFKQQQGSRFKLNYS